MPHPVMYADDDPGLRELRALCLAFPGAEERVSHGRPTFRAVAGQDLAGRVALDLEPPAQGEIAGHGCEPSGDPVGGGERVPDLVRGGVEGAADGQQPQLVPVAGHGRQAAVDRPQVICRCESHENLISANIDIGHPGQAPA